MLKDISSVKLQGANFSSISILPMLDFSDGKYTKISLIYGRNGSGKSTIAKAFRKVKGEAVSVKMNDHKMALSDITRLFLYRRTIYYRQSSNKGTGKRLEISLSRCLLSIRRKSLAEDC